MLDVDVRRVALSGLILGVVVLLSMGWLMSPGVAQPAAVDAGEAAVRPPHEHAGMSRTDPDETVYEACVPFLGESLAEEVCTLQYDGGKHGDATESCGESDRIIEVPGEDPATDGFVHLFDPLDRYRIEVADSLPTLEITLRASPMTEGRTQLFTFGLALRAVDEVLGCGPLVGTVEELARDEVRVVLEDPAPGVYDLAVRRTGMVVDPWDGGGALAMQTATETAAASAGGDERVCHTTCLVTNNRVFGYGISAD